MPYYLLFPITLLVAFTPCSCAAAPLHLEVEAEAAILMNGMTGQILFAKNVHDRHHPASITKVATAWLALEEAEACLDEMVAAEHDAVAWVDVETKRRANYTLPAYWLEPRSSHIGLKKGEELSLRTLLYGLLLASGDDAANVIAAYVGGSIPEFMQKLNERLQGLGCSNTHFTNPHGLYHPQHYTTAYDMALLAQEALRNPTLRTMVGTRCYPRPRTALQEASTFVQTNKLLRPGEYYYPYAIGVKTGWITIAQHTLIAAAERDGRLLIAVLLKSKDRGAIFRDARALFTAAYAEELVERKIVEEGAQPFQLQLDGVEPLSTYSEEQVMLSYYPAEEPRLTVQLCWDPVDLPIAKGQSVGSLLLMSTDGSLERKVVLKASQSIEKPQTSIWSNFSNSYTVYLRVFTGGALAAFLTFGRGLRRYLLSCG
jgi:D-alanyl-D-alanine carboxypeptidase (penicillin-binding protein 5/6)